MEFPLLSDREVRLNKKTNCNRHVVKCCGICNFEYVDSEGITEEAKIKQVIELAV